jgi:PAS domain S-box-containing protein
MGPTSAPITQDESRTLLSLASDLWCVVAPDGRFRDVAPAWEQTLGQSVGDLRYRTLLGTAHPDDADAASALLDGMAAGIARFPIELRHRHLDGSPRWVSWTAAVRQPDGTILAIARDVTERKRAEEAAARLNIELGEQVDERTEQLAAAVQELEAFAYTVSHDLRAPLRALNGFAKILLEEHTEELAPKTIRYLGLVRENAVQLGDLVDDLLEFSRLSRHPIQRERVNAAALVQQVVRDMLFVDPDRDLEVSIGALPACDGDPLLIKQVFVNLLDNAFKYTKRREPATIEVGGRESDREIEYFVRDTGVGFDMRYESKLFGVFQRLHRSEEYEGTGVGLANVQRIIHRHGGRVWAESAPGEGATFSFTIPRREAP